MESTFATLDAATLCPVLDGTDPASMGNANALTGATTCSQEVALSSSGCNAPWSCPVGNTHAPRLEEPSEVHKGGENMICPTGCVKIRGAAGAIASASHPVSEGKVVGFSSSCMVWPSSPAIDANTDLVDMLLICIWVAMQQHS